MAKLANHILIGTFAFWFSSCGVLKSGDDDKGSSSPTEIVPNFELTGSETTELSAFEVGNFVRSSEILKSFHVNPPGFSSRIIHAASKVSSGGSESFANCVSEKISKTPLMVTDNTIGVRMDYDFIALCDEKQRPEDKRERPVNKLTADFTLGCANMSLDSLRGKTFGQFKFGSACNGAKLVSSSYHLTIVTRKVSYNILEKPETVFSHVASESFESFNGTPCIVRSLDKQKMMVETCRSVLQRKTYAGAVERENHSPNDKEAPGPRVVQSVATVRSGVYEANAPYYDSATSSFEVNGWKGSVTYDNGWIEPKWTAKLRDSESSASGTLN